MSNIVERLRGCLRPVGYVMRTVDTDTLQEAAATIERLHEELRAVLLHVAELRAEIEEWKERWAAERRDHEATIRHFDKLMDEAL
jgi:hypothetical protein